MAPDEIDRLTDLVSVRAGIGRCEVVCFTSDHQSSFGSLPPSRVRTVMDALADRTREMSRLAGVAQVFPFENRGVEIGVTLDAERSAGVRVIGSNAHGTAYVPAAARWPFEVQIAPHRPALDIPDLSDEERDAFGPLYLDVLRRFDLLFGKPMPYISAWHQAVVGAGRDLGHLHLQLFSIRRAADKLKFLAGSESAMGFFVNDVVPETAARLLREVG